MLSMHLNFYLNLYLYSLKANHSSRIPGLHAGSNMAMQAVWGQAGAALASIYRPDTYKTYSGCIRPRHNIS